MYIPGFPALISICAVIGIDWAWHADMRIVQPKENTVVTNELYKFLLPVNAEVWQLTAPSQKPLWN